MRGVARTLVALCLLLAGAVTPADASAGVSCHTINAKGVGQDLGGGRTEAQIVGGGLLHGTTQAAFTITGLNGTVASFVGAIVFTVNNATLTANVAGTLDVASGVFAATTSGVTGTGKLVGATGSLAFNGVEDLTDGSFTEDVNGEICVDLSP
jgi:hypothetical protein